MRLDHAKLNEVSAIPALSKRPERAIHLRIGQIH